MKYERIEYKRPVPDNGQEFPFPIQTTSNQRHLSVNFMEKISTRQKHQQKIVKNSNGQRGSSGAGKRTFQAKKETINKAGSKEGIGKLILIPNVRQQVRKCDAKLSSENKSRKALHGIPLKMAKQSHYGNEADNDGVGNKYHKDGKSNAGKKSDEGGNKPDKSRNDGDSYGKEKTQSGYPGQGRFEKGNLELQTTEIKSRDRTRQSAQNVPAADKAPENKFPKNTVNKNHVKHTPSGKDTVPLQPVSAINKRGKNEINDKIQKRESRTQRDGKLDLRSRGQGRPSQVESSGHGHISNIRQTDYSNKQRNYQNYPPKKQRQSVDIVVGSRSKPDRNFSRPSSCVKPRATTLSRADAIRPCDYLRAVMEDREMCFPKVCAPCPPCRPSTPRGLNSCAASLCDPCQSSIVQCSC